MNDSECVEDLKAIVDRIRSGVVTDVDISALRQLLSSLEGQSVLQFGGKYNINIGYGGNIYIGEKSYTNWDEQAIQDLICYIQDLNLGANWKEDFAIIEKCNDQDRLIYYLDVVKAKLRDKGCISLKERINYNGKHFNMIARILSFDSVSIFGITTMRGEAFFLFSEFSSINISLLKEYTSQCLRYSRSIADPDSVWKAIYDFHVPSNICFSVAIVDTLDEPTERLIYSTNPFGDTVDPLWYSVPVVCELNRGRICFYQRPDNIFEFFRGEIAWVELRKLLCQIVAYP